MTSPKDIASKTLVHWIHRRHAAMCGSIAHFRDIYKEPKKGEIHFILPSIPLNTLCTYHMGIFLAFPSPSGATSSVHLPKDLVHLVAQPSMFAVVLMEDHVLHSHRLPTMLLHVSLIQGASLGTSKLVEEPPTTGKHLGRKEPDSTFHVAVLRRAVK